MLDILWITIGAAASWSAAVLSRFPSSKYTEALKGGRALPHSKTLPRELLLQFKSP